MYMIKHEKGTKDWYYEAKMRLHYIGRLLRTARVMDHEREKLYLEQINLAVDLADFSRTIMTE